MIASVSDCAGVSALGRGRASSRRAAGSASAHERSVQPPATRCQLDPVTVERLAQLRQRRGHLVLPRVRGRAQVLDRDGLGGEEEQRLDRARERAHARDTVIGPNGSACCQPASPWR